MSFDLLGQLLNGLYQQVEAVIPQEKQESLCKRIYGMIEENRKTIRQRVRKREFPLSPLLQDSIEEVLCREVVAINRIANKKSRTQMIATIFEGFFVMEEALQRQTVATVISETKSSPSSPDLTLTPVPSAIEETTFIFDSPDPLCKPPAHAPFQNASSAQPESQPEIKSTSPASCDSRAAPQSTPSHSSQGQGHRRENTRQHLERNRGPNGRSNTHITATPRDPPQHDSRQSQQSRYPRDTQPSSHRGRSSQAPSRHRGHSSQHRSHQSQQPSIDGLATLTEMFPNFLRVDIEEVFAASRGNVEAAAAELLSRPDPLLVPVQVRKAKSKAPEVRSEPKASSSTARVREEFAALRIKSFADDAEQEQQPQDEYYQSEEFKKFKKQVEKRFLFTRAPSDSTLTKPVTLHNEMSRSTVRYLDNKVVNTKGQRFTVISEVEPEEMKKTYIPLRIAHTKRAGGKGYR